MGDSGGTTELKQPSAVLNSFRVDPRVHLNHAHAAVYSCAILALLCHHALSILHSPTLLSFSLTLALTVSDLIFSFMWVLAQAFRWRPVRRQEFPDRLAEAVDRKDWPGLDVFVCTADPHKEPPMGVVNTVLSTMAFDYPAGKLSVYVSDDGGSQLTLFALMEAARFAGRWLPLCRERRLVDRCPEVYFRSDGGSCSEDIKIMYKTMKEKVENVVERGWVLDEDMPELQREAFGKWTPGFTRQEHPSVIQVLLDCSKDVDITSHVLPNLVYVSREKNRAHHHNFKAGALNALIRVSGSMSNGPMILTLDCDMYSNDPRAPQRALCYMLDPAMAPRLAYVQFPQRFQGIDENDIYANEHKRLSQVHPTGMNGLRGPNYLGTGCFFVRRSLHGSPSSQSSLYSNTNEHVDGLTAEGGPAFSEAALKRAHQVTSCTFEHGTKWGSQMGFRYGSIVEDFNTGYHLHCEGWESIFCHPRRPAFLGEMPINLNDVLGQVKRWCVGFLEVGFSKYCPLVYGTRKASLPTGMCYAMLSFWGMWCFPIMAYSILPQMALAHHVPLFPKGFGPWFWLYAYLFLAANAHDLIDFLVAGGTIRRWWNDQRMWMMRGVTSHLFGVIEFSFMQIGLSTIGFNVTSKVVEAEHSMRYKRGVLDYGVESPLFVSLGVVSLLNLSCFLVGLARTLRQGDIGDMFLQLFLSGFIVINCCPVYEAMFLRRDSGKMPGKVTAKSLLLTGALHIAAYFIFEI